MAESETTYLHLAKAGLWTENPGLVKLLGLCPLLAVSNTTINGLSLGLATLITLLISNTLVSALRSIIAPAIRIPLYVLVIATTVSVIELLMQAWLPGLFMTLGIFLPLIVTNCLILGRAEAFAAREPVRFAVADALAMGMGFIAVLVLLGALREFIGQGSILIDSHFLFGEAARSWSLQIFDAEHGLLMALLPPGAFIGLGLLLALKNLIDNHSVKRKLVHDDRMTAAKNIMSKTKPRHTI